MHAMTVLSGAASLAPRAAPRPQPRTPRSRGPKIRPRALEPKLGHVKPEFVDDDCAVVAHLFHTGRDPGFLQRSLRASSLGPRQKRGAGLGVRCFPG